MQRISRQLASLTIAFFLALVALHQAHGAALIDLGIGLNYEPPRRVSTDEDFSQFASSTLEENESVESITYSPSEVRVKFREEGRLLALVPITYHPEVIAYPDGDVEIDYPWYSRITVDKKAELENSLRSAVSIALNSSKIGVVHAAEALPKFSAQKAALVIAAILKNISTTSGGLDTRATSAVY